jgi:hypothetical protein
MVWRRTLPLAIAALAFVASAISAQGPALGQETIDQFNAANAENRRHTAAENQLRNDALQLRQDQARGLLNCQGAGAVAACRSNRQLQTQQRGLMLDNQIRQERDFHRQTLQGIGVTPLQ